MKYKELDTKQRIPKLKGLIYHATILKFNPILINNYKNQLKNLESQRNKEKKVIYL